MLLVEYLEEASAFLRDKKARLKVLDAQYRKMYDRDIKKEGVLLRAEMSRKHSEITSELLYNLDEFRALHKYYPELLQAFMEDEYVGRILSKKAWLLDFKSLPAQEAAARLEQLRAWRMQLRDAKKFLKRWVGTVNARSLVATFPVLRGHLSGEMDKVDAIAAIEKADRMLLREGWLLLIGDALIQIPIAKFMGKINDLLFKEMQAKADLSRSMGRGTVAETVALRKFQEISKKRQHYERVLTQVLLANPEYLRRMKKTKNWLSRERAGNLEKLVKGITPHTIKERAWLDRMRKKLESA